MTPLRIVGVLFLAALLIAFVVSFLSGLGDGRPPERVTGDAARGGRELDRMGPRLRVEVLNAAGVGGLARRATEHLRDRGFDVVHIDNADTSGEETTVVVARTPDVEAARRVAHALGTDSVIVDADPQLYVDATVRLGRDWPAAAAAPAGVEERGVVERVKGWVAGDSAE